MEGTTPLSTSTIAQERLFGTGTVNGRRRPGYDRPLDIWPDRRRLVHEAGYDAHPWPWLLANADAFNDECELARTLLADRIEDQDGRVAIKPGTLSEYSRHRAVEWLTAQYVHHIVAPYCEHERPELEGKMRALARKLFFCRQGGPFGVAGGELVVAWDEKCGHKKLCPDEARQESLRLEERLAPHIAAHGKRGRVYKAVFTLPNYPPGRLREGMRHIVKRFRDRLIRSKRFGVAGALVIVEAPLSKRGDWNVHLNAVLLTRRWLSYGELREAWGGYDIEIKQVADFSERGMHRLFAECVKYAVRSVAEKSLDERHRDKAPPLIEWPPELFLEWFKAHHPFRRTRTYGTLFRVPEPERETPKPVAWIGRLEYRNGAYQVIWRGNNHAELLAELGEHGGLATLDSIRGYKSTVSQSQNGMRGPP